MTTKEFLARVYRTQKVAYDQGVWLPITRPRKDKPPRKPPYVSTDNLGKQIVNVPLGGEGSPEAKINVADWHTLVLMGVATGWHLQSCGNGYNYVRVTSNRTLTKNASVARLVMRADEDQIVKHRNGNPLDLRWENLELVHRVRRSRSK